MKKILTLLTGIVFLIAILIAAGCSQKGSNGIQPIGSDGKPPITWEELDTVKIYLKAFEEDEKMRLKMFDSNDLTNVVVDSLVTYVTEGTQVIWMLAPDSGIRKIKKISPAKGRDKIIVRNARGFLTPKIKKLKIPGEQTHDDEEEYYIKFKDTNGNNHEIDPYLKIRKQ